jgi:hypothetical protein
MVLDCMQTAPQFYISSLLPSWEAQIERLTARLSNRHFKCIMSKTELISFPSSILKLFLLSALVMGSTFLQSPQTGIAFDLDHS